MTIDKSCPIEFKSIDLHVVRLNALFVFLFSILFLFTKIETFIYMVAIDFTIRVFFGSQYSPVCIIIKKILNLSGIQPELINAGPKTFAAKIGFILSILIFISSLFNFNILSVIIVSFLIFASGLEAIFNFCLACKIYPYFKKFF